MKYDDASWHYGGDFPPDSPHEFGATHIALFMRWCFSKGWAGRLHTEEVPDDVARVVSGEMPATEFFLTYCDEKLTDEDFNEEGRNFADRYYGGDGLYLDDYGTHFGDLMYVSSESEHDFSKFSAIVEKRYRSGVLTRSEQVQPKPWWKFW